MQVQFPPNPHPAGSALSTLCPGLRPINCVLSTDSDVCTLPFSLARPLPGLANQTFCSGSFLEGGVRGCGAAEALL